MIVFDVLHQALDRIFTYIKVEDCGESEPWIESLVFVKAGDTNIKIDGDNNKN